MLSGGQQQRVALARAIAVNSRLLLMDEPLSNLDARLREDVRGKIRDLAKQLGSTVLYVTHDQIEAMAIADKIALMQAGELLQVGTPAQIYHKPNSADVADFFGSVNWLDGEIVAAGVADSPIGKLQVESAAKPGQKIRLGFRPENLRVVNGDSRTNCFNGKLVSSTFLGDQFTYCADANGRQLVGQEPHFTREHKRIDTIYRGRGGHHGVFPPRSVNHRRIVMIVRLTALVFALACFGAQAEATTLAELIEGARKEGVLRGQWGQASFGGSEGFKEIVANMNKKYKLDLKGQYTPGPDMQALMLRIIQESAAGQPASTDVYLGNAQAMLDGLKAKCSSR